MFKIGDFSKMSGLSVDTLYYYEKMNILLPAMIDKLSGYRFYEASQILSVNKVLALKDAGFSLNEISQIINYNLPTSSLLELLEEKCLFLEDRLNDEIIRLERLHTNIFLIKNGGIPQMNEITIKKVEAILVASTRETFHEDKFDERLEVMWRDVNRYIEAKGGKRTIPCMMLYHIGWRDMDDTSQLDVEVVEPVTKSFQGNEKVHVYELPVVEKMASIIHNGPFSTFEKTTDAIFEWIKLNGYTRNGSIREIYHKGDWATNNPDEYVTELQIPLK